MTSVLHARKRIGALVGFVILFAIPVVVLHALWRSEIVTTYVREPYWRWLASTSGMAIACLGVENDVQQILITTVNGFRFRLAGTEDALELTSILALGIGAVPAPWRMRILGMTAGLLIMFVSNAARIVLLVVAGASMQHGVGDNLAYLSHIPSLALALACFTWWAMRRGRRLPEQENGPYGPPAVPSPGLDVDLDGAPCGVGSTPKE